MMIDVNLLDCRSGVGHHGLQAQVGTKRKLLLLPIQYAFNVFVVEESSVVALALAFAH